MIKQILLIIMASLCIVPMQAADKPAASSGSSHGWATVAGTVCTIAAGGIAYCAYRWFYTERYWSFDSITKDFKAFVKKNYPDRSDKLIWNGMVDLDDGRKISLRTTKLPIDTYGMELHVSYFPREGGEWRVTGAVMHSVKNAAESREISSIIPFLD